MEVSVIVPTYNRGEALKDCLAALLNQDFGNEYEILVIDDGSTIKYELPTDIVRNKNLVLVKRKHGGPAIARNYGISIARGKYVIFIGDDIICPRSFINDHYSFLLQNPNTASAGYTTWHPDTPNTDLFSLLQYVGLGNFSMNNKDNCGFCNFTTSNIALPEFYLERKQFDEKFPYPALEDTELGFRLYRDGLKIKYNEKAAAYHRHKYRMEELIKRQWQIGYSIGYFVQKYPELERMYIKPRIFFLLSMLLRKKIFFFFYQYQQVAECLYQKYRGLREFRKNVKGSRNN